MSDNKEKKEGKVIKYNEVPVNKEFHEAKATMDELPAKKKVTTHTSAVRVKEGFFKRMKKQFIGDEGEGGVADYIAGSIIIPAVKQLIVDSITSGIQIMIMGKEVGNRPYNNSYRGYIGYQGQPYGYNQQYKGPEPKQYTNSSALGIYDIVDRTAALNVLHDLREYAERYGIVTVADYYEMISVTTRYTDNNYGWDLSQLDRVQVVASGNGYYRLTLPEPRRI